VQGIPFPNDASSAHSHPNTAIGLRRFERDGYANHAILAHIIRTVLMLALEAFILDPDLREFPRRRITQLGACLEPIADQPQRLIDSAAGSETRMVLPELMPDGFYTSLQERVLTAFSLLFTRATTFGSIVFSCIEQNWSPCKRGHLSSDHRLAAAMAQ
jgi:hypothetical protein